MALHDYAEMDEEDFYGQDFDREGVVSVWVGLKGPLPGESEEMDVLQDLCGVGYYDMDHGEGNCNNFELLPLQDLLSEMSYSDSFATQAEEAAAKVGITHARWVQVQYDFAYDPKAVKRPIADDPVFIGFFPYVKTAWEPGPEEPE
jgi:hypothetical protein